MTRHILDDVRHRALNPRDILMVCAVCGDKVTAAQSTQFYMQDGKWIVAHLKCITEKRKDHEKY